MATQESEYTAEQEAALAAMCEALNGLLAAMGAVAELGLDPMGVILSSLTPEQLAELPLPVRMMLG